MNRLQSDTPYSVPNRAIFHDGSITITYIHGEVERAVYKNTSCQLSNYTVTSTLCSSCTLLFCKASILVKSNMEARYPLETQIGNNIRVSIMKTMIH
ncbi:hypothetical protein I4U23_003602 [Adineta vaga]|nr:hypothetical protein I4U23_003602 [Adineta vaga]